MVLEQTNLQGSVKTEARLQCTKCVGIFETRSAGAGAPIGFHPVGELEPVHTDFATGQLDD